MRTMAWFLTIYVNGHLQLRVMNFQHAVNLFAAVHVLSYRFPIPIRDTESNTTDDLLQANLVYDHKETRIYQVVGIGICYKIATSR